MKKLVLGLLAAALVMLGLVGTSTAAQADPYPGSVVVSAPTAKVPAKANKAAKIALSTAGNVVPTGTYKTVCKAKGHKKVKKSGTVNAKGFAKTGKLAKGKWTCKVVFTGTGAFKSNTFTGVVVKAKK